MDAIQELRNIAANPQAYARKWKQQTGGKVVGTLCSYAPEELILAGGALAHRIVGGSGSISKADAHLQAYSCSLVRGALEDALDGRLDFLDGAVFPHTCDSIQRLSDIWRLNATTGFHLDAVLPVIDEINRDVLEPAGMKMFISSEDVRYVRDSAMTIWQSIGVLHSTK